MTLLKMGMALMLVLTLLTGCDQQEKNEEKDVSMEKRGSRANPAGVNSREEASESMRVASENLGILTNVVKELNSYNHDHFSRPADKNHIQAALTTNVELSEELKNPASIWVSTPEMKQAVIGKFSLMTGLIGVPDPKITPILPELFDHEEQVTNGDVLMLRIVKQASSVADRRVKLEDEHIDAWVTLAESKNKIYRYIALLLFDLLEPTPEQAETFYKAYRSERDEHILKLYGKKVRNSNIENPDEFLAK